MFIAFSPSVIFQKKNDSSLVRGSLCFIKFENICAVGATCGRPSMHSKLKTGEHSSSLRYVVVCTVSFATAFGCLSLAMQLLLFRKNHARLACSVVNALTIADLYIAFSRELSFISDNLTAAASHRPTVWDIIYHSIRSLNFCGFRTAPHIIKLLLAEELLSYNKIY